MNVNPMNNDIIPVDYISSEQNPHVDNQQGENSTRNYIKSQEFVNRKETMKKTPMTPTPLYFSFFSFSVIIIYKMFY
jgi:hypothetical protein